MFPVVEDWSGDVQKAVCRFIETGYYAFKRPDNNSRVRSQGHHSLNHAQNTRSKQAEEVVFHVRVCELFMLWGVQDGPNTAYTLYKKALENTVDESTGFMDIVDFVFDGAWTASDSLEKALFERIYAQPQISQYPNYNTLMQAMESRDDFLNGLIRHILKVEDVQDLVAHSVTLTTLLARKCRRNDKKMRQGLPLLSTPPGAASKHEAVTNVLASASTALIAAPPATTNTPEPPINAEVSHFSVEREVQQPIVLAETYLQYYGWGDMEFALVLGNKFEQSLQQISTIEQFEVVVGRIYSMWQQGSQNLRDCLADWCIKNAEGIRQMGVEARIAAMTGLAGDIRRKENGQRA